MIAGSLTEPIKILGVETFTNKYGEKQDRYTLKCNTRANVIQKSGTRIDENGQTFYDYIKQFEVRFYVPVGDYDHIEYEGREYRITNIDRNKKLRKIIIDTEIVKK